MVMSGGDQLSPEEIRQNRNDRNGWLFAIAVVTISCVVILLVSYTTHHPWH